MHIETFLKNLKSNPTGITFNQTMAVIEANYIFTPTAFTNGELQNEAGQNSGSCKLFAFALQEKLTPLETLTCFGSYYFDEVLKNPEGTNHQNIRNFIKTGFEGLHFKNFPLKAK